MLSLHAEMDERTCLNIMTELLTRKTHLNFSSIEKNLITDHAEFFLNKSAKTDKYIKEIH